MAKLLIVDDDPYIAESLKLGLGVHGHEVFAGYNGREGVRLVGDLTPDLVIIDMTMPIMDGLEATQQIRKNSDVPIIMLTAETDEEDVINALELGVDEYLGKPFRLNELAARIQALIRRHSWGKTNGHANVSQLKLNLMTTMTHELRTPIATILNSLEIVFAAAKKDDFESQLCFLERVQQNTHSLNRLVDDLLLLGQIDEGLEILRRPFSLHTELDRIIEERRIDLAERGLIVCNQIPTQLEINGDTQKLRHLFFHLLDNAIKFSPNEQQIRVWAKTNSAGDVQFVVSDRGIGINPDEHGRIFDRFFQIETGDNRSYGGLGIGLAIAKAVAEAHNGNISVSSEPNAGSQFILTLPAAEADWAV
ncbi:MAG: hybrid sensor histidine kinase/response regulator [Ardenticatenaceae bacterium]|nr:MAG: hybrid sensor histidine kinase/response regulator [Ardenticatenaceae bacterium]